MPIDSIPSTIAINLDPLTCGKTYAVKVLGVNGRGAGPFHAPVSLLLTAAPAVVTGFALTASNQSFIANWTPPNAHGVAITKYILLYRNMTDYESYPILKSDNMACVDAANAIIGNNSARGCVEVTSGSPTIDTTTSVAALSNAKSYEAKVLALNARGAGAYSAVATVMPGAAPAAVRGLSLAAGNEGFSASWTAPANNGYAITGYILVYKNVTGSASYPALRTDNTACADAGGTAITNSNQSGCVAITTGSPTIDTTASVSSLTNGANYEVKVLAANARGAGVYNAPKSITPAAVPGVINAAGITVTPSVSGFTANWTPPVSNGSAITGYILVYRNATGGADYPALRTGNTACADTGGTAISNSSASGCVAVMSGDPVATTAVVAALLGGQNYAVKILAVNSAGAGMYSSPKTTMPGRAPAVPQNFSLRNLADKFVATWAAVSGLPAANPPNGNTLIQSYILVYRNMTAGAAYPVLRAGNRACVNNSNAPIPNTASSGCVAVNGTLSTPPPSTAIVAGLTSGAAYAAKILSVNTLGVSGYSSVANVTLIGPPDAPAAASFNLTLGDGDFTANWGRPGANGSGDHALYFGV